MIVCTHASCSSLIARLVMVVINAMAVCPNPLHPSLTAR